MLYRYALRACPIHTPSCMPYMYAIYARLICMPYMYAAMTETQSGDMMTFTVDSQPLGLDADMAISCEVRSCFLNLSPEFVEVVGAWARNIQGRLAHASSLAERTKERLAKVAQTGVQMGEDFGALFCLPFFS